MGMFDRFRQRAVNTVAIDQYFKLLNAYAPAYSTYQGSLYEMGLTRASIHTFASHCGKLQPKITGMARLDLERILSYKPNPMMDTYSFLYKLATILKVENTAFIIPIYNDTMRIIGLWPQQSYGTEVKRIDGIQYLLYPNPANIGSKLAVPLDEVGVMRNHFYRSSLYGDANSALDTTLNLMYTNDQGIINGVKNSANIRFIARLANVLQTKDVAAERAKFSNENLSAENNSGVLLIDSKYADVKQIESKQMLVDPEQMKIINDNIFNYFGTNQDILQNKFNEETWNAYYEGAIEPFAIQLSLVLSNMIFSQREIAAGNSVMFEANRLQYASNTTKISLVTQLFDRGFITQNQGLEIFNMAPVVDGDKRYIRKEYTNVENLDRVIADAQPDTVNPQEVNDDQQGS